LTKIPAALFIVDINKEHIAVAEARKLSIPTFAIVDTNTNPLLIDFPIPANDDAAKSIGIILDYISDAIVEGLNERKAEKDYADFEDEEKSETAEIQDTDLVDDEDINVPKVKMTEKSIKIDIVDEEEEDVSGNKIKKMK
jgi:small subunit ribosomal protein S2